MEHCFVVVWSASQGWHIEDDENHFPGGPLNDAETATSYKIDEVDEEIRERDVFLTAELMAVLKDLNNGGK
jgi:hypothetical protein